MSASQTTDSTKKKEENKRRGGFVLYFGRTIVVTLIAALLLGILAFLLWKNPDLLAKIFPPVETVQTVETKRWGDSVVYPIEGRDTAGKSAAFEVAVLPQNLSWAHKSTSVLAIDERTMIAETEVPERVFSAELREGLAASQAFIAVGLASQEGQIQVETQRAKERAESAAGWLAAIAKEQTAIWTLNLGQFKGGCEAVSSGDTTSWQRPLIVVGVQAQEDGVNLAEAFADAISGKTNLPSRDCYTSFELVRFR